VISVEHYVNNFIFISWRNKVTFNEMIMMIMMSAFDQHALLDLYNASSL